MPIFLNPFHRHDVSEFEGVYEPFGEGRRHPSVVSANEEKFNKDVESPGTGNQYSAYTLEGLRAEIDHDVAASGHDSLYDRKSKIINKAIQDIGMGRYQWSLFALCGFGWLADNLWLQGVALCLPSLTPEFGVDPNTVRYTTCALFVGLCCGASFWGIASDLIGRRPAFNASLLICGVFGIAVGGAQSWIGTCGLFAALGFGVGGNLPVDGALFLEFLPFASGNLLTLLSVWWPLGQLLGSLVAWGLIPSHACDATLMPCSMTAPGEQCCNSEDNKGWRYLCFTLGAMTIFMFICRFFLFHLFESPKFLLSRGRQSEAVASVHGIAYRNKTKTWLNEEILNEIGGISESPEQEKLTRSEVVRRSLDKFSTQRIAPLFSTRKLGLMTALIWFCWATIGMGYPLFNAFLPQYLANASSGQTPTPTDIVYRNYLITSVVGVPGSIFAAFTVNVKYIGRKGTIAFSALLTAIFLFLFTLRTDPSYQLAMDSIEAFWQNIMYGVLYALTPEIFPAPNRGTGTGIASFFNRLTGLCAPIIAVRAGSLNPLSPIYAAGGLILAAFVAMCLFPIETRGKQSL